MDATEKLKPRERGLADRLMPSPPESRIPCYFDGACPRNQFGNKGRMRAAFIVAGSQIIREVPDVSTPSGPLRSNNLAEYQALIHLLRNLAERGKREPSGKAYLICGDSQLVIRQMQGKYRVRDPHLVPLHEEASQLSSGLDVEFRWIPREKNPAGFLLEQSD